MDPSWECNSPIHNPSSSVTSRTRQGLLPVSAVIETISSKKEPKRVALEELGLKEANLAVPFVLAHLFDMYTYIYNTH